MSPEMPRPNLTVQISSDLVPYTGPTIPMMAGFEQVNSELSDSPHSVNELLWILTAAEVLQSPRCVDATGLMYPVT